VPIIHKISEFLPQESVSEALLTSKSASQFRYTYNSLTIEKNLTTAILYKILRQTNLESLTLKLPSNGNLIHHIDFSSLKSLKKLDYHYISPDDVDEELTTLRLPDTITDLTFESGSTILVNYPKNVKKLNISVHWVMNDDDYRTICNLILPSTIEFLTVNMITTEEKNETVKWLNSQPLPNCRYLNMNTISPRKLIIPPNLTELICGAIVHINIVDGNYLGEDFPEKKSFEESKLEILEFSDDVSNHPIGPGIPDSPDFELPKTLKQLRGVFFTSPEAIEKLRGISIEYLKCDLYDMEISNLSLIGGTLKSLIVTYFHVYLDEFAEDISNFPNLKNLSLTSYSSGMIGNFPRNVNSKIKSFTLRTFPNTDSDRVDFDGFLELETLEVRFMSVIPVRIPDNLRRLKLIVTEAGDRTKAEKFKDTFELIYTILHVSLRVEGDEDEEVVEEDRF